MTRMGAALLLSLALSACGTNSPASAPDGQQFIGFVERYFTDYSKLHPIQATLWGYHDYDGELGRYDAAAMSEQAEFLKRSLSELQRLPQSRLDAGARRDRRILEASIHDELIDLEEWPVWRKNPGFYADLVSNSILPLVERTSAPKSERLRFVILRERQIPGMLENAKSNLQHPPRELTETAISQFSDTRPFFRQIVPAAFADASATELLPELKVENDRVIRSIEDFIVFLQKQALPHADSDFALGTEVLQEKLKYGEMVEDSLDTLRALGMERLKQQQAEFAETARRIDPTKSPIAVLEAVTKDHPTSDQLIPAIRNLLEEVRAFCIRRNLVTIPSEVRCEVTETPPFARTLSIGSLDVPGPYEPVAQQAYFKVTLPDPSWSAERTEGHLRFFNSAALPTISAFEVYPGRYLQYLWLKAVPSKVRRILQSDFFKAGWAHYSEQMILDEGYRNNDPKVRLAMQRNALLRLGRFLTAIGLHSGQMTPQQSVDFFMNEAYQERANAERETRRSVADPIRAISYFWGKAEIQRLRDDFQKQKGPAFSLKEFHNELLRHGAPPIPILREILLQGEASSL